MFVLTYLSNRLYFFPVITGRLSRKHSDLFLHLTEERRGGCERNSEAVLLVLNSLAQAFRLTGKKKKSVHAGCAINSGSDKYLLSLPT